MIEVYHGSTLEIVQPLVKVGRPNLDFGRGFYLTDIREQAEELSMRLAERKELQPIVNVYNLDMDKVKNLWKYHRFEAYDIEWLQFIVDCRMGSHIWETYDVIEGGVANDRVIDSIEAYIAGYMPLERVLEELSKHQPNNQICITNQSVIADCLTFNKSYHVK